MTTSSRDPSTAWAGHRWRGPGPWGRSACAHARYVCPNRPRYGTCAFQAAVETARIRSRRSPPGVECPIVPPKRISLKPPVSGLGARCEACNWVLRCSAPCCSAGAWCCVAWARRIDRSARGTWVSPRSESSPGSAGGTSARSTSGTTCICRITITTSSAPSTSTSWNIRGSTSAPPQPTSSRAWARPCVNDRSGTCKPTGSSRRNGSSTIPVPARRSSPSSVGSNSDGTSIGSAGPSLPRSGRGCSSTTATTPPLRGASSAPASAAWFPRTTRRSSRSA